jgi:hypothetical protein
MTIAATYIAVAQCTLPVFDTFSFQTLKEAGFDSVTTAFALCCEESGARPG